MAESPRRRGAPGRSPGPGKGAADSRKTHSRLKNSTLGQQVSRQVQRRQGTPLAELRVLHQGGQLTQVTRSTRIGSGSSPSRRSSYRSVARTTWIFWLI